MSAEGEPQIEIYQSRVFEKAFDRLSDDLKDLVDEQVDVIVVNPEVGERKKGDLSHLWVHKFDLNNQEVLLGYSWVEDKLELYLLNLGPHENFYKAAKKRRKADLKLLK